MANNSKYGTLVPLSSRLMYCSQCSDALMVSVVEDISAEDVKM